MRRKYIVVVILFLLLFGVNVSGDIDTKEPSATVFDGNILYCGGSGAGNYTTIQSAINDAVDDDTVFVYDDSSPYYENLEIDKSINLIGEDRNTTIIDGENNDYIVIINTDFVNIKNFYLRGDYGVYLESSYNQLSFNIMTIENSCIENQIDESHNNFISNNKLIHNNYFGEDDTDDYVIYLQNSNDNIIYENTVYTFYDSGLIIIGNNNHISKNTFVNSSYYGYYYYDMLPIEEIEIEGDYNVISNNTIFSGDEEAFIGISVIGNSCNNLIDGNNISGCSKYGISIPEIQNNMVSNNIIYNCFFGIDTEKSNGNTIIENKIFECYTGISIMRSNENIIMKNEIYECNEGIGLYNSNENIIIKNEIYECEYGILLESFSKYNNISLNNIHKNIIGLELSGFSKYNMIYNNNFLNNDVNAKFLQWCFINNWNENFWDKPRDFPYPIFGNIRYSLYWLGLCILIFGFLIPTIVKFDWHPASEPYDIEV